MASATLHLYVRTVAYGNNTVRLRSATTTNNWGAVLNANATEWDSTDDYLEDTVVVTGVGWVTFAVDPAHVDLVGGDTYFRFSTTNENSGTTNFITFDSQDGTNKPYLEYVGDDGVITRMTMGVGL